LLLSQYQDTTSLSKTLIMLDVYRAQVVLLPDTVDGPVRMALENATEELDSDMQEWPRRYFNEVRGADQIKQLAVLNEEAYEKTALSNGGFHLEQLCGSVTDKYLALAASAAILKYSELRTSTCFASHTLPVRYQQSFGIMGLDVKTIRQLELVQNARSGRQFDSLLGVINHTKSPAGTRLLRQSILQPLILQHSIVARQNSVQALLGNESLFFDLRKVFESSFLDFDKVLRGLSNVQMKCDEANAIKTVSGLISLKHSLNLVQDLATVLEASRDPILSAIQEGCASPVISELMATIHEVMNEDTQMGSGGKGVNARTQQVFVVKAGLDPLLDVARQTYSDVIEKIYAYGAELAASTATASLKISQDTSRGFFLSCKITEEGNLPANFLIHRTRKGQKIQGQTRDLSSLNQQYKETWSKIMELTQRAVEKVVHAIREEMAALYSISDSVAILDMLLSFATLVTCTDNWVLPDLSSDKPIAISKGRHPLVEALQTSTAFVPNDTLLRKGQNMTIITGANMAGKSTYLRQVGIITILGHMGCYVPAEFAELRLTDRILTRLGSEGGIADVNASGFYQEMQETSYILENVTDSSLVLIDELCRGTSNMEGAAIAFAVAEQLAVTDAFVLMVTHHLSLTKLEDNLLNVKTECFSVSGEGGSGELDFSHKLQAGSFTDVGYGITVASNHGIPLDVTDKAIKISKILLANREADAPQENEAENERADIHELATILLSAMSNATLPEQHLRDYLRSLKDRFGIAGA